MKRIVMAVILLASQIQHVMAEVPSEKLEKAVTLGIFAAAVTGAAVVFDGQAKNERRAASRDAFFAGQAEAAIAGADPSMRQQAIDAYNGLLDSRGMHDRRAARYQKLTYVTGALAVGLITSGVFVVVVDQDVTSIVYRKRF